MSIAICLLLMYSFLALLFDLATDRIPNYLVAAELICGLAYQLYIFGPMGILSFFGGIAVPFVLSYALFLFRMIGAGDIKLLMALGSVAGFPRNVKDRSYTSSDVFCCICQRFYPDRSEETLSKGRQEG